MLASELFWSQLSVKANFVRLLNQAFYTRKAGVITTHLPSFRVLYELRKKKKKNQLSQVYDPLIFWLDRNKLIQKESLTMLKIMRR